MTSARVPRAELLTWRDPAWLARLVLAVSAFAVTFSLAVGVGGDRSPFAAVGVEVLAEVPSFILTPLVSVTQVGFGLLALAFVVTLVSSRQRHRIVAALAAGGLTAASVLLIWALSGDGFIYLNATDHNVVGTGAIFPSLIGVAVVSAIAIVDRPWRQRREGLLAVVVIVVGSLARELVSQTEPLLLLSVLCLAWLSARTVMALLGSPDPRPSHEALARSLERFGIMAEVTGIDVNTDRDLYGYFVRTIDQERYYVKVVHRDGWRSLLVVRLYRALRFLDPADSHPFRGLAYRVEHEALCTLKAASDGVPTARVAVVTPFGRDAMLMAFEATELRLLSFLPDEELTDDLLQRVWAAAGALRTTRTGHRRLRTSSLAVDREGEVLIIEFSVAQLGAESNVLGIDLAELLSSLAARVGPERAVATGVSVLGVPTMAVALPHLQPLALSAVTRRELAAAGGIDALSAELQAAVGVAGEAVEFERLERVKPSTAVTVVTSAVALILLAPQLLGSADVWNQIGSADLWWVVAALGASVATYAGAAWAFDGAVPGRLPFWSNLKLQLTASFVGIVTTAASMAISTRYLQRRGIDLTTSATAVGLNSAAGVVVHLGLLGAFLGLGGSSEMEGFELPSLGTFGLVAAGVLALAAGVWAVPRARRFATKRIVPPVQESLRGIRELVGQPAKVVEVIGGSAAVTFGYILALYASCLAIAPDSRAVALVPVALVYLVGSVVSSVAPTPGGLGAVEAALVAGLASSGLATSAALGAVLIFRGVTFWLPILPGWWAFGSLQRHREL